MPRLVEGFTKLVPLMADFITNIFTEAGRTKIIDDLSKLLSDLVTGTFNAWWHKDPELVEAQQTAAKSGQDPDAARAFYYAAKRLDSRVSEGGNPMGDGMPQRAYGSLGTTGKLFENFGSKTNVELHGTESVVTPSQLDAIMQGSAMAGTNALAESLSELTSISSQMLHHIRETADYAKRNLAATKALSNDLFAA